MTEASPLPRGGIRVLQDGPGPGGPRALLLVEAPSPSERKALGLERGGPLLLDLVGDPPALPRNLERTPSLAEEILAALARFRHPHPGPPGLPPPPWPAVMGILNVTPDSFSDGGRWTTPEKALEQAALMVEEGAHVLDVGGESTRPGAGEVPPAEEIRRVVPVIRALRENLGGIPISVDTRKAAVAREALQAGADWVNDVSALRHDPEMAELCAGEDCPVVLMHMRGTDPRTMQEGVRYQDPVAEIHAFLRERAAFALQRGIREERILLDPGIGFGKRPGDNLAILKRLSEYRSLGFPLLVGASRKSFIGICLDRPVEERLHGTTAAVAAAVLAGARVVRVHDVKAARDAALMAAAVREVEVPGREPRENGWTS